MTEPSPGAALVPEPTIQGESSGPRPRWVRCGSSSNADPAGAIAEALSALFPDGLAAVEAPALVATRWRGGGARGLRSGWSLSTAGGGMRGRCHGDALHLPDLRSQSAEPGRGGRRCADRHAPLRLCGAPLGAGERLSRRGVRVCAGAAGPLARSRLLHLRRNCPQHGAGGFHNQTWWPWPEALQGQLRKEGGGGERSARSGWIPQRIEGPLHPIASPGGEPGHQ